MLSKGRGQQDCSFFITKGRRMDMESNKIPLHDIYSVAYCSYKGANITLSKEERRVIFHIPDIPSTYRLLAEFNNNPNLPLLDYLTHLRKLRAQMINLRG
jgi:hypothetical protein